MFTKILASLDCPSYPNCSKLIYFEKVWLTLTLRPSDLTKFQKSDFLLTLNLIMLVNVSFAKSSINSKGLIFPEVMPPILGIVFKLSYWPIPPRSVRSCCLESDLLTPASVLNMTRAMSHLCRAWPGWHGVSHGGKEQQVRQPIQGRHGLACQAHQVQRGHHTGVVQGIQEQLHVIWCLLT